MAEKLHWIKVKVKHNPQAELSVSRRLQETNHSTDPIVVVWSLNDPNDPNVVFDASGYFTWLQPVPAGVFSEPVRSYDGRRIVLDVFNPAGLDQTEWKYKLRASGPGPNDHYETVEAEPEENSPSTSGGGGGSGKVVRAMTVTNPAIINR